MMQTQSPSLTRQPVLLTTLVVALLSSLLAALLSLNTITAGNAHRTSPDGGVQVGSTGMSAHLTGKQLAQWRRMTDTPAERKEVAATFEASFGHLGAAAAEAGSATAVSYVVEPVLAYGYDGHLWMTASYADMAAGAIWVAVRYCSSKLPSWLCNYAGNKLTEWARGWGSASNHGVWAALYWNGTFQGGRW